jgi:chromosome segregation ATPase
MQVQLIASESSLAQISDLINEFAETTRAVSALRSTCMNTEKRVIHESQLRDYLLRETERVSLDLSLSDCVSKPIKLTDQPPEHFQEEVDRLSEQLSAVTLEFEPWPIADGALYISALSEIVGATEKEATLSALPIGELKADIDKLERELADIKGRNREMRRAIRQDRQRSSPDGAQRKQMTFDRKIAKLDAQLIQLREALFVGQANLEEIHQQVVDLEAALSTGVPEVAIDLSADSTDEGMSESTDQIAEALGDRRDALEDEVTALRETYREGKRHARAHEATLTNNLRILSARLASLQQQHGDLF